MIEAGPLRTVHNRAERRRWICRIEKSKRHVGEDGVVKKYQENTQRSQVIEGRDSLCSQGFCLVSATIKGPVCHRTFSSFSFSPNSCCEGIQKYNAIYMPITLVSLSSPPKRKYKRGKFSITRKSILFIHVHRHFFL